jgi:hypothetical protein
MARGGLEGPQAVERRQSRRHGSPQFMSLSHVKPDNMSFVENPESPDIGGESLALGGLHVHLFTPIDDKSS